MLNIHQKFCRETFYDGKLVDFKPVYQDNFILPTTSSM